LPPPLLPSEFPRRYPSPRRPVARYLRCAVWPSATCRVSGRCWCTRWSLEAGRSYHKARVISRVGLWCQLSGPDSAGRPVKTAFPVFPEERDASRGRILSRSFECAPTELDAALEIDDVNSCTSTMRHPLPAPPHPALPSAVPTARPVDPVASGVFIPPCCAGVVCASPSHGVPHEGLRGLR
jgi:hypothetical protein